MKTIIGDRKDLVLPRGRHIMTINDPTIERSYGWDMYSVTYYMLSDGSLLIRTKRTIYFTKDHRTLDIITYWVVPAP